jgi:diacylglycerol kinase (ATP)
MLSNAEIKPDVLIFTSPKAGSGCGRDGIASLVDALHAVGKAAEVTTTLQRVHDLFRIPTQNKALVKSPLIITAGGDGTLALVAQNTPPKTVLLPMPLGTENLLAKQFRYATNTDDIVRTVLHGKDHAIDAGVANGKLFLVMATCGFDAEVVRAMHLRRRGHINRMSYASPIWRTLMRYRFPPLQVVFPQQQSPLVPVLDREKSDEDGDSEALSKSGCTETVCRWAMVFNLPRYAAGLDIEPEAVGDDGSLNFLGLCKGSLLTGVRYLGGVVVGRHIQWKDVTRLPITQCRITSSERVSYQLDGDYGGRLPLDISILPKHITLRLPLTAGV